MRLNRGDRRGAFRLALFVSSPYSARVGDRRHARRKLRRDPPFRRERRLSRSSTPALVGMFYLAVEPFVRRRWPDALVSWTRVLAGQFRDPIVGRDILIGALLGVGWAVLNRVNEVSRRPIRCAARTPSLSWERSSALRFGVAGSLGELVARLFFRLRFFFLLFLLRLVLRKRWLPQRQWSPSSSPGAFGGSETPLIDTGFFTVVYGGVVFVLIRFGLVAYTISLVRRRYAPRLSGHSACVRLVRALWDLRDRRRRGSRNLRLPDDARRPADLQGLLDS